MALWRLTLDVPYSFAVEPGFQRDPHHREFRPEKDSFNNTVLEPATNLLMLRPSYLKRNFNTDFKKLSNWQYTAGRWEESYRGQDPDATDSSMFSSVKPATGDFALIELSIAIAIVAIEASVGLYDEMKWVLQSNFSLEVDEGFVIHYHVLGDEFRRKRNWYIVMWDNIALHFSYDGRCRVYQYDRDDLTTAPVLKEEFVFASPGELLAKSGYFVFLPIPGYGLSVTHSRVPQKNLFDPSNVNSGTTRAHLVQWNTRTIGGNDRLFESSQVRIGMNPYIPINIGFQNITYTAGDYTDAIFDPGFKPSVDPSQLDAYSLITGYGTATAELRKADNTGAWAAGTDRQGRVKVSLTPDGGGKHTPFVMFWDVAFDPQFATRNTTPLELASYAEDGTDRLMALEWGDDAYGRFEGKARAMMSTASAKAIALRGDATFRVDWRYTTGDAWETLFGGFAKEWKVTPMSAQLETWYDCEFTLAGMEERFRETHRLFEGAFDGSSVGSAIQGLLRGCTLPPLASVPTEAQNKLIPRPPDGKVWRFSPKEGDGGEEILRVLLLFLHTQGVEWRMPFDWDNGTFVLEARPKYTGANAWNLVAYDSLSNAEMNTWAYGERPQIDVEPPEANVIILEGMDDPSPQGKRVYAAAKNVDSISNTSSADYLGRARVAKLTLHGIADKNELNIMARRVKDAISHRRQTQFIPVRHLQMGLGPNIQVFQYDAEGNVLYEGYIKHRAVTVAEDGNEEMTFECDSVWEDSFR